MSKCECKECVHEAVCNEINNLECRKDFIWYNAEYGCPHYKSKSLFVELPCKVGDKLYFGNCIGDVIENEILDIQCRTKSTGGFYNNISIAKIGKTVFLTKEEAEKKLKEMG